MNLLSNFSTMVNFCFPQVIRGLKIRPELWARIKTSSQA
ncbi:hypothetical protein C4K35_4236 [Pseudomonas chlororaphis subsp. piscium]|nr:hypothetical protein C4K35_4236 [Pseudomonas chlororaphis subsp. piscium]AZD85114.1 hypothetical protein C4K14_2290 [Pseudomonas chlororaphis subsp. aureofaciens]